jgi:hypothetical protein
MLHITVETEATIRRNRQQPARIYIYMYTIEEVKEKGHYCLQRSRICAWQRRLLQVPAPVSVRISKRTVHIESMFPGQNRQGVTKNWIPCRNFKLLLYGMIQLIIEQVNPRSNVSGRLEFLPGQKLQYNSSRFFPVPPDKFWDKKIRPFQIHSSFFFLSNSFFTINQSS